MEEESEEEDEEELVTAPPEAKDKQAISKGKKVATTSGSASGVMKRTRNAPEWSSKPKRIKATPKKAKAILPALP